MSQTSLISIAAEVDRHLSEADSLKYGDFQRLLTVAGLAASSAQALGDYRRYALALNHLAWAYGCMFQYEPSLTHALEAMMMARAQGFVDIEARAVNIIAMNFIQCGIVQEAVRLYEHQLDLGEQLGDAEVRSTALHDLGILRLGEKDYETAADLIRRSLEIQPAGKQGNLDLSVTHGNLAAALCELGRYDEALANAKEALSLAHGAESVGLVGQTHTILGTIYARMGDAEAAYEQVRLARDCIEADAPNALAANIEYLTAQILTSEERYADAIEACERAYELAYRGGLLEFAIQLLDEIKQGYERAGDTAGVIGVYERLTKDIPRLQKQGSDLRFTVVRMVFAMDKAAVQAEVELTRQKNAILQRLSHEFRTPLTIIQSTAELVEKYGDRLTLEQRQERLQRITGQVKWMTLMLEDIVELLKIDEAQPLPPSTTFCLDDLARGALLGLERYRAPDASVIVNVQPDAGPITCAQKTLETILVHLLSNAVKFSKSDVVLDLALDGPWLVMRVADRGIGIPEQERAEIFKPLVRGSNLDEISGSGLGLALVAKLVEQLRGTIDLVSAEGEGTTVTVRVPVQVPSEK